MLESCITGGTAVHTSVSVRMNTMPPHKLSLEVLMED